MTVQTRRVQTLRHRLTKAAVDRLRRMAGRAPSVGAFGEMLEPRVMLAGDHPSLTDFPSATNILLDGAGNGSRTGVIEAAGGDDLFVFTANRTGFARIEANGAVLDTKLEVYADAGSPTRLFVASGYRTRQDAPGGVAEGENLNAVIGFSATSGTRYFLRVLSDQASGAAAIGAYTLSVRTGDGGTDTPAIASVGLDGGGEGAFGASIASATDVDHYQFTAPVSDFVTTIADAINSTGSTLDTSIEIYDTTTGAMVVASGGNGALTGGQPTDGWAGFVATAGRSYVARVFGAATPATGKTDTGNYTFRVDARPTDLTPAGSAAYNVAGTVGPTLQDDIVYKLTNGSTALFRSLITINATTAGSALDSRLDVYDAQGVRIAFDSEAGFSTNAFTTILGSPSAVYYIRVRSDEIVDATPGNPGDAGPHFGSFTLSITANATAVVLDPVTRLGRASAVAGGATTQLFSFVPQGTGETILTHQPVPMGLADPALHLYDDTGAEIAFIDDYTGAGTGAQINIILEAGRTYYVLAEGFDVGAAGNSLLTIESNHTFLTGQFDDHANFGDWNNASPVVWNFNPRAMPDYVNGGNLNGGAALTTDRDQVIVATLTGRIHRVGDTDIFSFTPPVDMLSEYAGKPTTGAPPRLWTLNYRPGTRLQAYVVRGNGYLNQPLMRIYDSNLTVLGTSTAAFVGTPPFPQGALAGFSDPAAFNPLPMPTNLPPGWTPIGPQISVWGGEEHFIEIGGGFEGRYEVVIVADALPTNNPTGSSVYTGTVSTVAEVPNAGQFASAPELIVATPTGDTFYPGLASGTFPQAPTGADISGGLERRQLIAGAPGSPIPFDPFGAGAGIYILQEGGLAGIEHPLDTDLYRFRAPFTGYAEIRIQTTGINDFYSEFISDGEQDPTNPTVSGSFGGNAREKIYNSPLDSALRAFAADQQQLGYSDDNPAIAGVTDTTFIGNFGDLTFHRRDARLVIPIVQNQLYYVQVESGQRAAYQQAVVDGVTPVDWRRVIGSYRMLIHTVPNLGFTDDHQDQDGNQGTPQSRLATVIPVATSGGGNGTGSVSGSIQNIPASNPSDTDLFTFISPVRGTAQISISRPAGSSLIGTLTIFDSLFNIVASGTADNSGNLTLSTAVTNGERLFIRVLGSIGTQGAYTINVAGLPFADDHANFDETFAPTGANPDGLRRASDLALFDFLGSGTVQGSIEATGDNDVFRVSAFTFQSFTVTVTGLDASMNPRVDIYEQNLDRAGAFLPITGANAPLYRVAFNDDFVAGSTDAQVTFAVTPNRTSLPGPNGTGRTYANYYIVVSGSDPTANYGRYNLAVSFPPSDDHADANSDTVLDPTDQFNFATSIVMDAGAGTGRAEGITEQVADTDVFRFTAPAGGPTVVQITRPAGVTTAIVPRVTVLTVEGSTITVIAQGLAQDLGGGFFLPATTPNFNVVRSANYFIVVENTGGVNGAYRVNISGPAVDDHPNAGEFQIASVIPISTTTGDGQLGTVSGEPGTPRLTNGDTDLFQFTIRGDGPSTIAVSVLSELLAPRVTLFDANGNQIGSPVSATQPRQAISITTPTATVNTRFYVLISPATGVAGASLTGEFRIDIDGPQPTDQGGGGEPVDQIDFTNPTVLTLNAATGNVERTDQIEQAGDRDLFRFQTFSSARGLQRRVFVQLVTPAGSALDASITILNAANEQAVLTSDAGGFPGVEAAVSFLDSGNNTYWVIVDGAANGIGTYTLRIDAEPVTHTIYYPEGYASASIREFVSISNSNTYEVNYTVLVRYEIGELGGVITTGTIAPGSRGGVTLSDGQNGTIAGLRSDTPYSIIIESDGPLGATLAHYDFGSSVGDAFTETTSFRWDFARVERVPGSVFDFLVWYNPNTIDAEITITAQTGGAPISVTQVVPAGRRGGVSINDIPTFPTGIFGVTVTAAFPNALPADQAQLRGIVAAQSHYDASSGSGFGIIGDATGGATKGVLPSLTNGDGIVGEITLFNPGSLPASVTLNGNYTRTPALPAVTRSLEIPAFSRVSLRGSQLNLVANQPIGLTYTSNVPVVVLAQETQRGDANATAAATQAGTAFYFGDAFINTVVAGQLYFETLAFSNPAAIDTTVNVRLLFSDSDVVTIPVVVPARRSVEVRLHERDEIIINRPGLNYFSIEATAASPFVAQLTHYDLFLGGGWTTSGVPFGPVNSIARVP